MVGPAAPFCTLMLRFLQIAEEMQDFKCKLRREVVPQTAQGYIIDMCRQLPEAPLVKRLRSQAKTTITLMASSISGKGREYGQKHQPEARASSLSATSGDYATLTPCVMFVFGWGRSDQHDMCQKQ